MVKDSKIFYDRIAFLYPIIDAFLKPQKSQFFRTIQKYPKGTLLDVGVGNGSHFKYYDTHQVIGVDTSKSMLRRANRRQKANIQLLPMNGERLAFPDSTFDYVILSHVIAVVEEPEKLLEEVYRVLKPRGIVFLLNHFTPDNWLKYLDRSLQRVSRLFHFKSVFKINSLLKLKAFKLLHARNAGLFSYFKILIYEKIP